MNRFSYKRLFYYYHYFGFFLVWYAIQIIQWHSYQPDRLNFILKHTVFDFLTACLLSWGFVQVGRWACQKKSGVIKASIFVSVSLLYPSCYLIVANIFKSFFGVELHTTVSFESLQNMTLRSMMIVVSVNGVFFWSYYRNRFQEQLELSRKAESLAKDAQLLMLRYQINPHFLFNILNSLHALVDEDKKQAKNLIIRVSEYYRSTLKNHNAKATIGEELDIVKQYFDIQRIRFGEQLCTRIDVDEELLDLEIPCFMIHLLVENAVKYSKRGLDGSIKIDVIIRLDQDDLRMTVQNIGSLDVPENVTSNLHNGTQSGLENIRNRLELYYSDQGRFELLEQGGFVVAQIVINQACL